MKQIFFKTIKKPYHSYIFIQYHTNRIEGIGNLEAYFRSVFEAPGHMNKTEDNITVLFAVSKCSN